jgi:hypothetical protein
LNSLKQKINRAKLFLPNKFITFIPNMKIIILVIISFTLLFCSPKGPITYDSPFIGRSKAELFFSKGEAKTEKVFKDSKAYLYIVKEEYFGKKVQLDKEPNARPKKTTITEHIYYINNEDIVYKYQVWKKIIKGK